MKIDVEISKKTEVRGQWVPHIIGLCVSQTVGPGNPGDFFPPDISIFVDLTAEQARDLAADLNRHARMVEEAHEG